MISQSIRTIAATPTEAGRQSYRGSGGCEGCDGNCDYFKLLALTCLTICLILLTATDNVDARLGYVVCRVDVIGERETRAVADPDDVMANSSGDERSRRKLGTHTTNFGRVCLYTWRRQWWATRSTSATDAQMKSRVWLRRAWGERKTDQWRQNTHLDTWWEVVLYRD